MWNIIVTNGRKPIDIALSIAQKSRQVRTNPKGIFRIILRHRIDNQHAHALIAFLKWPNASADNLRILMGNDQLALARFYVADKQPIPSKDFKIDGKLSLGRIRTLFWPYNARHFDRLRIHKPRKTRYGHQKKYHASVYFSHQPPPRRNT